MLKEEDNIVVEEQKFVTVKDVDLLTQNVHILEKVFNGNQIQTVNGQHIKILNKEDVVIVEQDVLIIKIVKHSNKHAN